jgi:hypothetical protein
MQRILLVAALAAAACTNDAAPDEGTTTSPALVTHFIANGNGVDGFVTDGNNGGFLQCDENVTQGVRTVVLSFALTFPDPVDGTKYTQKTGSGLIPSGDFTSSLTSGTLTTTTTFPIENCTYSILTGLIGCTIGPALSFNLTWTKNTLGSFTSHGTSENTFGCVTITNQGSFTGVTANINGTWAGKTSSNDAGQLHDSHQTSVTKDFSNNCP